MGSREIEKIRREKELGRLRVREEKKMRDWKDAREEDGGSECDE